MENPERGVQLVLMARLTHPRDEPWACGKDGLLGVADSASGGRHDEGMAGLKLRARQSPRSSCVPHNQGKRGAGYRRSPRQQQGAAPAGVTLSQPHHSAPQQASAWRKQQGVRGSLLNGGGATRQAVW